VQFYLYYAGIHLEWLKKAIQNLHKDFSTNQVLDPEKVKMTQEQAVKAQRDSRGTVQIFL
jgi:hypothetical protein